MRPTSHQQGNQYTSNISKVGYSKLHGNWTVKLPDTKAPASDGDQRPVPVIQISDADAPMYESINGDYLLRPEGDTSSPKLGANLFQGGGNLGESIDGNQLQIQGSMVYCNAYKEIGDVTSGKEQDILHDDPCISTVQTQKISTSKQAYENVPPHGSISSSQDGQVYTPYYKNSTTQQVPAVVPTIAVNGQTTVLQQEVK